MPAGLFSCKGVLQEQYDGEQLDILAIAFTCVKVLYVGGAIERARRLAALLEPARQACATPLHQTVIRNEAAFYGCIQQLLEQAPPQLPSLPDQDQGLIYLCGDSHTLPGGLMLKLMVVLWCFTDHRHLCGSILTCC